VPDLKDRGRLTPATNGHGSTHESGDQRRLSCTDMASRLVMDAQSHKYKQCPRTYSSTMTQKHKGKKSQGRREIHRHA
jgi:hypothetical protein